MDGKATSLEVRRSVFQGYWQALWVNPLFGIGYGNIKTLLDSAGFVELGNTHNIFLGIATSYGILSLAFFVTLLVHVLRRLRKSMRNEIEKPVALHKESVFGMLCGLVGKWDCP